MSSLTFDRIKVGFTIPEEETSLRRNSYIVAGGLLILAVALSVLSVICLEVGLVGLSAGAALTLGLACFVLALLLLSFSLIMLLSREKRTSDLLYLKFEKDSSLDKTFPFEKIDPESETSTSIAERLGVVEEKLKEAEKFNSHNQGIFV
ncbi:hypothetical protein [Candidatus Chlamydia corallus]|uniref:hypothetical protein n=1 Tax=Candidatus Chlamydia corallus TaxID=2038470 RepID=UPI000C2FC866|nr:hypothetical protein [Candidatus Chlamydia corallus]